MTKPPKRIAFFATSMGIGGMERLMAGLARQMTRRGVDVEAWVAPTPYADATLDWMRAQGMAARSDAGVPKAKIHFVPCGVPAPPRSIARQEARQRLGLPSDAFVIVTAARLIAEKGVDDLIHAVSQMRGDTQNVVLLVAGDGPERPALQSLAACLPNVNARFLGHCEHLDAVYACGDVFALPSHAESFGLVFVEAALHGLPSVATNVGGIPEAVLDGGTGLLVPLHDRAALANALYRMRDDAELRRRLGIAAQARAQSQFSEDSMAESYLRAII